MDKGVLLLGLYVVGAVVFIALYSSQKLYNSFLMGVFWPLTAPFIVTCLLFFSVKGSAKKVMKKITEAADSNTNTEKEAVCKKEKKESIEKIESQIPQKIVYVYMTKPDVDTPVPAKSKQRVNKKVQSKQDEELFDEVVFEEANSEKK